MKKLLVLPFLLLTCIVHAQSLNRNYYEGISFNSSKSEVIEIVLKKLRTYLQNNINGSATYLKKKKGINILSGKNKEENYTKIEDDIRTMLQKNDDWGQVDLYRSYNLYLGTILGNDVKMPMAGQSNAGKNGPGTFMVYFKDGYVSTMNISLATTKDYTIHSGYAYTNAHLADVANIIKTDLGSFTYTQYNTTWNSCSSNNENVPMITYTIKNGNYTATMTFEYGIYQQRVMGSYKGDCRAAGNHLTSISMQVYRN